MAERLRRRLSPRYSLEAMSSIMRTATFLFTDLENSTPLWENHPNLMQELAARHDALLREAIEAHRGQVVKTTGDGFHAVFEAATDAVAAALAGQQAIIEETWPADAGPLRVRMGLHTGESREREGDYYGPEVNRAARVMGVAHGGQIVISAATAALIRTASPPEVSLLDLGEHRLRGLAVAEHISQVCHPALPLEYPPLKSLSTYRHNLPVQLSTFVGREKELADVQRLLKETHLLTLLGPGGTGKTRLMLESVEEVIGDFAHGVWLVELAPLADPDLIPERVAAALSVQEQPGRRMRETLADYLRHKEMLLLLDNVEHLVRESAEFAEYLLQHCPKLKLLVTGREALFIGGETTYQVPSLLLPAEEEAPEMVAHSEAAQLFLARAQAVRPDFVIGDQNASAVAEVVRRLDGIPLAIELAAARLRMLTVEQIAERLNDRFRLLTGGQRTVLPRQQTLKALIDWSWDLLEEKERALFRRLSVFSGGWSIAAAQTIASDDELDEYEVFDYLEQLINKSLVAVQYPTEGEARYGMLESIRQYAGDKLSDAGEVAIVRHRHAAFFLAFVEEAAPNLARIYTERPQLKRVAREFDNLRAAIAWTQKARPAMALRICGQLFCNELIWLAPREARRILEPVVEQSRHLLENDEGVLKGDFARALIGLAMAMGMEGMLDVGTPLIEEGIRLARDAGELRPLALGIMMNAGFTVALGKPLNEQEIEEGIAVCRANGYQAELYWILQMMGQSHVQQGDHELGMRYLAEAFETAQQLDSPRAKAAAFSTQAIMADLQGNSEDARKYRLLALELSEAANDHLRVTVYRSDLAHMARREGKLAEAEASYRKTIIGFQEQGNLIAVAHQLESLAFIAIARGQYARAARLLGTATETREQLKAVSTDPREIAELAQAMEQLAEAMGEEERDKALAEGRLKSLDGAVQLALDASS